MVVWHVGGVRPELHGLQRQHAGLRPGPDAEMETGKERTRLAVYDLAERVHRASLLGRQLHRSRSGELGEHVVAAERDAHDWGFYTQYLYGFKPKWAIGLRYEYVWGTNYSLNQEYVPISNNQDPFRDNRHRVSPLLAWYVTEFSRFNFQYNFDYAQHLADQERPFVLVGGRVHAGFSPGPQVLTPRGSFHEHSIRQNPSGS